MLLEQIEKKTAAMQKVYGILKGMKDAALEDYRVQQECEDKEVGDHKTMGIKLSEGARSRLEKVSRKYNLGRSKKAAALFAINAGCRLLLTNEELKAYHVEDIRPLME